MKRYYFILSVTLLLSLSCNVSSFFNQSILSQDVTGTITEAPDLEDETSPTTPQSKPLNKKCGDGVCNGPENYLICPEDCPSIDVLTPSLDPTFFPESPEGDLYKITNPSTGAKLHVQFIRPPEWSGDALPILVLVPGGIGSGGDFMKPGGTAEILAKAGFGVVVFNPDGRGLSEGVEDYDGFAQQDGLAEIIRSASLLSDADGQIGLISFSYGITMASGALARYPDLPVIFLIDWEGPADRYDTTTNCSPDQHIPFGNCSDDEYWSEREALTFIAQINVPYQRLQSEKDHVQPDVSHAINMINAAMQGNVPWTRLNKLPPNQIFNPNYPPAMLPENITRNLDSLISELTQDMLELHGGK